MFVCPAPLFARSFYCTPEFLIFSCKQAPLASANPLFSTKNLVVASFRERYADTEGTLPPASLVPAPLASLTPPH